ncbi:MAG: YkgJ family cysteine cluster protein [Promethearchaeota archaeon]
MEELRFSCTRCGNCCIDKSTLVNLTYYDILNIKNGLNLNIDEILEIIGFYVFNKKNSQKDKERLVITPIESEKGLAYIGLRKNQSGKCIFYSSEKKKCLIYNLRPMFCQTFPFTFRILNESKSKSNLKLEITYTKKGIEYCPGIASNAPIIDYDYWINLGKKTLEYLKRNRIIIENWNKRVKDGKIIPSAKTFIEIILKSNDI